ncbi:MAG TPA: ATP-binding cassette domain-containing protein [Candidatus Limnocylindrales bacterium]
MRRPGGEQAPSAQDAPPGRETSSDPVVLALSAVTVRRQGRAILEDVAWTVRDGERWVVLGPNGGGKTTLLSVAAGYLWPTQGRVTLLGGVLGRVDARELRREVGIVSAALASDIPEALAAIDVVVAGATGALAPWWTPIEPATVVRARRLLELVGCASLAEHAFGSLSTGERQRVQIARALLAEPSLLLLDEPAAGLDLAGRETLVRLVDELGSHGRLRATVLVTHHVEEIPPGTSHALVLRAGRVVAEGRVRDVVSGQVLSEAFGLPLRVHLDGGRFRAVST